jgi:hypothetical protein
MWRGGRARPVQATPALWLVLWCEELGCPRELAERSWQSLMTSRWSAATALRQWVLAQPYVNIDHFRQTYGPQRLIAILEALVQERRLLRHQATALEEYIFAALAPDGEWRDMKGPVYATS